MTSETDKRSALVAGVACLAVSAPLLMHGLGAITLKAEDGDAPRAIIAMAGAVFAAGGLMAVLQARAPASKLGGAFSALAAAVVAGGLAAIGGWIAFFPGERAFTLGGAPAPGM